MNTDEWGFPITGSKVSQVLRGHFSPEDVWELSSLDVPSGELQSPTLDALREKVSDKAIVFLPQGYARLWKVLPRSGSLTFAWLPTEMSCCT